MKVINIDSNTTAKQLQNIILENSDCTFIHYTHSEVLQKGDNLITEARKNQNSYDLLIVLANNGYYLYMTKEDKISSFVHHAELPKLWQPVKNGEYIYNEDGIVYSLTMPVDQEMPIRNLLVVFSTMSGPIYMTSLMRNFTQNFSGIMKYISPDTVILRIADLGGVVGSYYMNTHYLPHNEDNIQKLITTVKNNLNVQKVVLYGASKGGSAALLYSLYHDYDAVIVDPILSDEYYINQYNDSHFTVDIYPTTKQDKYHEILKSTTWNKDVGRVIISAINTPQLSYINDIVLDQYGQHFTAFINTSNKIKDQPEVAGNSMHLITASINCMLNDIPFTKENYFVI